ncbi:MAG: DUF1850 domain-containing protein [Treponema sp.]|nr:DUF1850 domain-containing protein [Treponema sp.]
MNVARCDARRQFKGRHLTGRRLIGRHLTGRRLIERRLIGRRLTGRRLIGRRFSILLPALVALLMAFCPSIRMLSIKGKKAGGGGNLTITLPRSAIRNGFVISYTHSVNKGQVSDLYSCKGSCIVLEGTSFISYGAGIPEPRESPGASFADTGSRYTISGMNRPMKELMMAVGLYARHSLATRKEHGETGEELFLEDYFEKQSPVIIKIRRTSPTAYLLGRLQSGGQD